VNELGLGAAHPFKAKMMRNVANNGINLTPGEKGLLSGRFILHQLN
jgi:hypothetical protein